MKADFRTDKLINDYFDNSLSETEKAELLNQAEQEPALKIQMKAWEMTFAHTPPGVSYPDKSSLIRKKPYIPVKATGFSVALLLVAGVSFFLNNQENPERKTTLPATYQETALPETTNPPLPAAKSVSEPITLIEPVIRQKKPISLIAEEVVPVQTEITLGSVQAFIPAANENEASPEQATHAEEQKKVKRKKQKLPLQYRLKKVREQIKRSWKAPSVVPLK